MNECLEEVKEEVKVDEADLVAAALPGRVGFTRKIIKLWSSYYRVNFHEHDKKYYITESYFVHVREGKVHAEKEKPTESAKT